MEPYLEPFLGPCGTELILIKDIACVLFTVQYSEDALLDDAELTEELLLIDEAAQACAREDEAKINDAKRKAGTGKSERAAFRQRYFAKQRELRGDLGAGRGAGRGRGRGRGAVRPPARHLPPAAAMDTMTHAEAKLLMPPDSYLWKARGHGGSWRSEVRPFKECTRSVHKHGFGRALWIVVSDAWRNHCVREALLPEECPMVDLAPEGL